ALAHGELAWLAVMRKAFDAAERHIALGLPWAREAAVQPWREGGSVGYEHQLRIIGIEVVLQQERWPATRAAVVEALESLPPTRRRERLSLLLLRLHSELALGEIEPARRTAEEATASADSLDIVRLRADVANAVADVAHAEGDLHVQERAAGLAAELAQGVAHAVALAQARTHLGSVSLARGESERARVLLGDARRQFEEQGMPHQALDTGSLLAELERVAGHRSASVEAALAVLAAGRGDVGDDATEPWPLLGAAALLRCRAILVEEGHAHADTLRQVLERRLQQQLAQLPDAGARQRLLDGVPHWREAAALSNRRQSG
ncbi:MAG: hypothetical protein ABIO45_00715, partial [Burkholderiaceae bacterium]